MRARHCFVLPLSQDRYYTVGGGDHQCRSLSSGLYRPKAGRPDWPSAATGSRKSMKHSVDRILTTHAGSLPRPSDLLELVQNGSAEAFDQSANAARLHQAVDEIVHKQVELASMSSTTANTANRASSAISMSGSAATTSIPAPGRATNGLPRAKVCRFRNSTPRPTPPRPTPT